jgi:succinyl-CoA synthetase beta subunit
LKLHEYLSKRLFARYGIPIPRGDVAATPEEARRIAQELGGPVAVKAQVLVGGRGKAGGIRLAHDAAEAYQVAGQILGMAIKGLTVNKVLVERAADIAQEIYLGLVIDRVRGRVVMMASSEGGVEIEEVAKASPEKIARAAIEPALGLMDYQGRGLAFAIGLDGGLVGQFIAIARGLYRAFVESDASLAEINPLVVTGAGELLAVDGKMVLDDNALFRHPDLTEMGDAQEETEAEREARRHGISYVKLNGTIGCMVNGAGLAMATMDVIKLHGAEPANFLDIGGGARAERVATALRLILSEPNVKAILLNIFGGITRCDEVARGIVAALGEVPADVPIIARLVGTNEERGREILAAATLGVTTASTLMEAAQKAVAAAHQKPGEGTRERPS